MSHTRENMSEEQRGGAYLLFDLHSGTETIKIKRDTRPELWLYFKNPA